MYSMAIEKYSEDSLGQTIPSHVQLLRRIDTLLILTSNHNVESTILRGA